MNAYRFVAASFFYRFLSWKETKKKNFQAPKKRAGPGRG